jgi:hypothetical protein
MAERNRQEQRAARERMRLTGENYTTALRHVREEIAAHVINPNAIEGESDDNQEAQA